MNGWILLGVVVSTFILLLFDLHITVCVVWLAGFCYAFYHTIVSEHKYQQRQKIVHEWIYQRKLLLYYLETQGKALNIDKIRELEEQLDWGWTTEGKMQEEIYQVTGELVPYDNVISEIEAIYEPNRWRVNDGWSERNGFEIGDN